MQDKLSDKSSRTTEIADGELDNVTGGSASITSNTISGPSIKSTGPSGPGPAGSGGSGDLGTTKPGGTYDPTSGIRFPGG